MVLEIARLDVNLEAASSFEAAAALAVPLFRRAPGCIRANVLRSHETPGRYWLLVDWQRIEDHGAFRASPDFAEWRELVGEFFVNPPVVEHGFATGIGFS